jgi:hypothetical protein
MLFVSWVRTRTPPIPEAEEAVRDAFHKNQAEIKSLDQSI